MDQDFDHRIVATFANIAEALVARQILETAGVPCRMTDDAQLGNAIFAMPGSIGCSAAIWVLAADVERATALLAEMQDGGGVDEADLAEEALRAPPPREPVSGKGVPARRVVALLAVMTLAAVLALILRLMR